jgi:hypothetical protein
MRISPVFRLIQSHRINVRFFLLLVFVIAVPLGYVVRQARVQSEAVKVIKRAGGSISYDWEYKNGRFIIGAKPPVPGWLTRLLGVDLFCNVVAVKFDERGSLAQLVHMDAFRAAYQRDGRIVGKQVLRRLSDLSCVEVVHLDGAVIDDDDLLFLKGLQNLVRLSLSDTAITDYGLSKLKGCSKLRWLDVSNTRTTLAGVRQLLDYVPNLVVFGSHLAGVESGSK